jgi:putative tricarboxylic transport membrane protein
MMEVLQHLMNGFQLALQPMNVLYCLVGVTIGTAIGVLPGIGPAGAIALLLPVTYHVDPLSAVIMIEGIMYGAQYGGSTTSILVNIPGEPSSLMTCIEGYQMARKGRAGPALGISAFASYISGSLCLLGLIFFAPPLAEFGLKFGPPENFALMAFGLALVIYLARSSLTKALAMLGVGIVLASVGLDPMTSALRFTYDLTILRDGLGLAQVVIGLFGISEVLENVEESFHQSVFETKIKGLLPTLKDWKVSIGPILRGTGIGFFLGLIPGISVIIPTFISYTLEKKISRHPEEFGTGVIEGVAGPEATNNAASAGLLVPLLSLGIPTGASSALLLGALMIYGFHPGPLLIKESPHIFWGLIASMYLGNVLLLVLNLPLIGVWVKVLRVPYDILFSLIVLFCVLGSYTINNNAADVVIMILFGGVGYLMRKYKYEAVPLILALVLGPMWERALRRSLIIGKGSFMIFFERPISAVLLGLAILILLSPLVTRKRIGQELIKKGGTDE